MESLIQDVLRLAVAILAYIVAGTGTGLIYLHGKTGAKTKRFRDELFFMAGERVKNPCPLLRIGTFFALCGFVFVGIASSYNTIPEEWAWLCVTAGVFLAIVGVVWVPVAWLLFRHEAQVAFTDPKSEDSIGSASFTPVIAFDPPYQFAHTQSGIEFAGR